MVLLSSVKTIAIFTCAVLSVNEMVVSETIQLLKEILLQFLKVTNEDIAEPVPQNNGPEPAP